MKELWYLSIILLMLGILAGFSHVMTPTGAFAGNLPPQWDFPTTEVSTDSRLTIDLTEAFYDPDGDPLSFSVSPSKGISAGLNGDTLVVIAEQDGEVVITASDGIVQVSKTIIIHKV